jgi:hypothetical protein
MRHQKFHLIGQNSAVAQNEIFPQAGYIRCVEQRHVGLLGCAGGFAMVAAFASSNDVHPIVFAFERVGNDVLAGEFFFMEMAAAISANVAVTHEELAVGQAGAQVKRVDARHTFRADDGADVNDALLAGDGVVTAAKGGNALAHFPTHLVGSVVDHRLLHADPTLWQPLSR